LSGADHLRAVPLSVIRVATVKPMNDESKPSDTPEISTGELPEQSEKEVHVPYWKSPPPLPVGQEMYELPYIPLVPEGEEVTDETPSPPIELD
jgi:hypothetical protein